MSVSRTTKVMMALGFMAPVGIAVACFYYVPSTVWGEAAAGLITALSLIMGAILLRVMRAFPVTDPDGFEDKTDIEVLETALQTAMRSLTFAAVAAVSAITLLVLRPLLVDVTIGEPSIDALRGEAYSAIIGLIVTFVATRIVYVVRLDFSIARRQARAVRIAYEKKRSRETEQARRAAEDVAYSFKDSGSYPGRRTTTGH